MQPETIGIVGGLGRMGALMARFFTEGGLPVRIVDRDSTQEEWRQTAQSDVVLLAVPIPAMEETAQRIGPLVHPQSLLADIASLKTAPLASMKTHFPGEVLGTHPLFGPKTSTLEEQIIFTCQARPGPWSEWLCGFWSERGAKIVEMDPERHDQLMSRVQVLRHMFLICFGRSLMRLGFDTDQDLPFSGPWFNQLLEMLDHHLDQAPQLYADLTRFNPAAKQVLSEFRIAAGEVADSFGHDDPSRLIELINEVSSFLRSDQEAASFSRTSRVPEPVTPPA